MDHIEENCTIKTLAQKGLGKIFWITISIFLFLDQITKLLIVSFISINESIPIIKNFFDITHIRNPGVAFGLFSQTEMKYKTFIMSFLTILSIVVIISFLIMVGKSNRIFSFSLYLIMAGALGNLIDRLTRSGTVIDFIDVHYYNLHWPSFNIADSSITVGVILLIFDTIFTKDKALVDKSL
jgi:signal peptidase II